MHAIILNSKSDTRGTVRPIGATRRAGWHEAVGLGVVVALAWLGWLFAVDAADGHLWRTAVLVGGGVWTALAPTTAVTDADRALYVAVYVVAQAAVAVGPALLALGVARAARRRPDLLVVAALAFPLVQFLVVGATALLAQTHLGPVAWPQFVGADVVAAAVTLGYLARTRPECRAALRRASADAADAAGAA